MKRLYAILLATLMLITNMSITFAAHFCSGEVVSSALSIGQNDINCGMGDTETNTCDKKNKDQSLEKKSCCENIYTTLSAEDFYKNGGESLPNLDFKFITAFVATYLVQPNFLKEEKIILSDPSPFLIQKDKTILFQVFLI